MVHLPSYLCIVISIVQEMEGGKYIRTDEFIAHCVVTADGRNVLLATDKYIDISHLLCDHT